MNVYTVSDLHVDYPVNMEWVNNLSLVDYQADILVLAGDITDRPNLLTETLVQLKRCFSEVIFVPGNHDLWTIREDFSCSVEKFERVMKLANQLGVITEPWSGQGLTVLPLLSWYDYSFGHPGDWLQANWMDFHACDWNKLGNDMTTVSSFFSSLNEIHLAQLDALDSDHTIISFSHFLPRIDLMPSHIPEKFQRLYPVFGSKSLDLQIRKANSTLHVYGHSHVNRDVMIDGINYVNNAFGNPRETRIASKTLKHIHCSDSLV